MNYDLEQNFIFLAVVGTCFYTLQSKNTGFPRQFYILLPGFPGYRYRRWGLFSFLQEVFEDEVCAPLV